MTKAQLLALIDNGGGDNNVLNFQFDNSMTIMFYPTKRFSRDMIQTIGGVDYMVLDTTYRSKKTGGYSIPVKSYHPLDFLQEVGMLQNGDDMGYIDTQEIFNI